MNRKQVEFDFRVYPVGPAGAEGSYNHEQLRQEVVAQYIASGWEVLKTEISQVSANVLYLAITFVKYEVVSEVVSAKAK